MKTTTVYDIQFDFHAGREPQAFGPFKSVPEAQEAVRKLQLDNPDVFRSGYRITPREAHTRD